MKYPKPSQYPKSIQVKDAEYRIVFVKKLKDGDLGGCTDRDDGRLIFISLSQDPQEMFATFWHEVLHAYEFEYKSKLTHKKITKLERIIAQTFMLFDSLEGLAQVVRK